MYEEDDTSAQVAMDLAQAYPRQADIASWVRTIRLDRGKSVTVSDDFRLRQPSTKIATHLMTTCDVHLLGEGQLRLVDDHESTDLRVRYAPPQLRVEVESMPLQDGKLAEMWGAQLRRITLHARSPLTQGAWSVRISPTQ
jgi:hypothetical protein